MYQPSGWGVPPRYKANKLCLLPFQQNSSFSSLQKLNKAYLLCTSLLPSLAARRGKTIEIITANITFPIDCFFQIFYFMLAKIKISKTILGITLQWQLLLVFSFHACREGKNKTFCCKTIMFGRVKAY